jgi:DNA-directed RNA polymerase sigma subunit (sigma70/sigma32)
MQPRMAVAERNVESTRPSRLSRRGGLNGRAKLTEESVREIRRLYDGGRGPTLEALGRSFGVSEQAVWQLVQRRTWAHVA